MQINFREFRKSEESRILNEIKRLREGSILFDTYERKMKAYDDFNKQYDTKKKESNVQKNFFMLFFCLAPQVEIFFCKGEKK